jgi:hypothetical protein
MMKRYHRGEIVVMAEDVEEARKKVRKEAPLYIKDFTYDVDSFNEKMDLLLEDLKETPFEFEGGIVFIPGSE